MSKKPLSERVTWLKFPDADAYCFHAGVSIELQRFVRPNQWEVTSLGGCFIIEAATIADAKRQAIKEVQKRVAAMAKAWRD